ncbi:hypothetical protein L596_014307 [Steinernema carpocapsae]|uniref:Uncharacterized protein n=1 Tax=Steinernema carpocapsae TaxID=34508 RepID=A0A4V6A2Q5_STECR|nr:hypothetical protein L596_014307 [Steinernema carpocapsae]
MGLRFEGSKTWLLTVSRKKFEHQLDNTKTVGESGRRPKNRNSPNSFSFKHTKRPEQRGSGSDGILLSNKRY